MTGEVSIREPHPPAHPQRDTHKFDSSEQYTQVMGSDYRLIEDDIPFQQAPVVIFQTANFVETRSNIECFIALFLCPIKQIIYPHSKYVWDVGFAYLAVAD